jgi:D-aminopeptidase
VSLRGDVGGALHALSILVLFLMTTAEVHAQEPRPRARDVGVRIGVLQPGPLNAITDVGDVRVGHHTLILGDSIRTGVTAIVPHGGDLFADKVAAAIVVRNGFGKLVGLSQVNELGQIETPILLTGTLSVFKAADALVDTLLADPAHVEVRSINPVVGETNDGYLSDIRARPVEASHVRAALRAASTGAIEEGAVGAGTGTRALGWKGGIGTASRRLPESAGGYTVGALVQTNYGGILTIAGVPVGRYVRADQPEAPRRDDDEGGSVMVVLATDAPLAHRELYRLGERAFTGIARTGSWMSHGSGDYAIVFSTHRGPVGAADGGLLSRLFVAAAESVEEAVVNSLFKATTTVGFRGRRAEALRIPEVLDVLEEAAPEL